MDDLYENLDNYNEESTIAELKTENNELKHKLEEYAGTLSKLQKEFDKLSSEYKQLELNYSSLLKTAKAEIERKTQIITNLNLEKDRIVLTSFQNKNTGGFYKSRGGVVARQNYEKDNNEKNQQDEKLKNFEGRKSSTYSSTERKDIDDTPSSDTTVSSHIDLRSKLLNLAHGGQQHDPRTQRSSDLKENIMQPKTESDASKARASIRNRRKSMPAISVETEQISEGDDIGIAASSTNLKQTSTGYFSEKQKHVGHNFQERPTSRTSETSSLEEKKFGYHEPIPDRHKRRSSRYDRDTDDKYRVRHKSSHRYRRESPDRYPSGSREYHDPFYRSEHDRPRAKGRESPPRDKYHQRQSRELYRNYERSQRNDPYEHERLLPRSQERYAMKRRVEHIYDELENKRLRMEPHSRPSEENRRIELDKGLKMESYNTRHEGDRRINDERKPTHKSYTADPLEIQFSTCESPDYVYPDSSNQQVKEIKLTATTKLDDPRISSKKYVFRKDDSQSVLTTSIGRNVVIVPLRQNPWGITPVSMPEALVKRPPDPKQSAKDVSVDIENPANISIESGEIKDKNVQNYPEIVNKVKDANSERKVPPLPVTKFDDSKDLEKSLKKINSYKIPKHRKSIDDKQNSKHSKEVISSEKPIHDNTDSFKSNKNSEIATIETDVNKQQAKPATEKKEPDHQFSSDQLPCLGTSNMLHEQRYPTAKEVVEGDLEMSDDNCDDHEKSEHVTKIPVLSTELENKAKSKLKNCDTNTEKQSTDTSEKVSTKPCQDKTSTGDNKKSKTRKKSKHKEIKDACKSGDSAKVFEKPAKKKEKKKENTSLQIKTKFSELFDDSSSLIFPEDLGLTAVPVSTTLLPDKCVPFFEDALDAADLITIKSASIKDSIAPDTSIVEMKPHTDVKVTKLDTANQHTILQEDSLEKSDDKSSDVQTEITDDVIKSIYQNLEPGGSEEEENVVKTVIISTGIQPPVLLEDSERVLPSIPEPLKMTIQNALATSTPHKIWQPDAVVADMEPRLPDSSHNSNNNSQIVSVGNSELMDKSDSNTVDSQANDANVPDVRIFIKRRRKNIKK